MPNIRLVFRIISTFLSRFKFIIFVSVFFGIIFFVSIRFLAPHIFFGQKEIIGVTGRYTTSSLPNSILKLIGAGLTKLDVDGTPLPDLAKSWETTDNGRTWVFKLNKNNIWQDSKKMISSDINYQFSDVVVEKPDQETLVFKLQNMYSAFPAVVSKPIFKKGLLGTGEHKVKKLSISGNFVKSLTLEDKQGNTTIYKFYPTEEITKTAFKLGEVNKLIDIIDPSPFDKWPNIEVTKKTNKGEFVALFLNTSSLPLSEKNLRQALHYAINKEAFGAKRALSPISEDSWAYNSQVKPYDYDLDKAKKIFAELPKEIKDNLVINLSTSPILLSQAEMIAKNWKELGINIKVQTMSTIPQDFQALLAIFDIPDDPDQYSVWHSTQTATNISKYQNQRIDKLLEDGRSEINGEARRKIYLDFQRYLVEDSPAIFLYYPNTYTIKR